MKIFKPLTVWSALLLLAIANGLFREEVLLPALGLPLAYIISGSILAGAILLVAYLTLPWIGRKPASSYATIGIAWLCLTLVFEFVLGRIVLGKPWAEIFAGYTFSDGNLWPLVLMTIAIAPYVSARCRGWV
jgi:hypothetical protein